MLDKIIARIEESLPLIHERVAAEDQSDTPVGERLSPKAFKRAQAVFQDMSEDSILTDDEQDIRVRPRRAKSAPKKGVGKLNRINGKHP